MRDLEVTRGHLRAKEFVKIQRERAKTASAFPSISLRELSSATFQPVAANSFGIPTDRQVFMNNRACVRGTIVDRFWNRSFLFRNTRKMLLVETNYWS